MFDFVLHENGCTVRKNETALREPVTLAGGAQVVHVAGDCSRPRLRPSFMSSSPPPKSNRVAPPPPPPPAIAQQVHKQKGFRPGMTRALSELLAVMLALGALVWGLMAFGGSLAAWLIPLVPMSVDRTLGEASQQQFLAAQSECSNPRARAYIEELAAPMLQAAGPLPFEFSFRVVDSAEVNAFALPGGFVTVNWGLVEAAESGEEIAGVMGHEIQHALLRHGTRRILRKVGTGALLSLLLGGTDLHAYGQAAAGLSHLSYDRDQESEADEQGVALMRKSGIDPSGLATFFARLAKSSHQPPAILSTHPDPGDRARLVSSGASGASYRVLPAPGGITCHVSQ